MLTLEETREKLTELVERLGPDTVYEVPFEALDCAYSTADGEPSCLVGHLIDAVAPEVFEMIHNEEWEDGVQVEPMNFAVLAEGSEAVRDLFNYETRVYLNMVQGLQDRGRTWGDVLTQTARY